MDKKRIASLLAGLCLLAGAAGPAPYEEPVFAARAEAAAVPYISADAAIVVDTASGQVLYEKNADKREYPASMTKVMTCVLALENADMDRIVEVSPEAADVESTYLHAGYRLEMKDMLTQMMLVSDNGAATAVGESLAAGDIHHFADRMNLEAREIGMTATHFVNANGMPDADHYSTARDISRLFLYALKKPLFRKLIGTTEKHVYYVAPTGGELFCENTNELLYDYPGCIGGKTGWTRAARGCLVTAAQKDGHELAVVVMHSEDTDTRFQEAAELLDYGFELEKE